MNDKKVILVVEDEISLQKAIRAKLEINGFDVLTARKADDAIDILQSDKHVDAVWLDHYLLGNTDGLMIVTKLKEEGSNLKQVPVFVVSNTATPDKVRSYIRFGVEKYFTKANHRLDEIIDNMKSYLNSNED